MASMYDGLGGEERSPSGLTAGGTPSSVYTTGSVTSEGFVSGLNIYGTGSILGPRVQAAVHLSGLNIYGTGSILGPRVQAAVHLSGLDVYAVGSIIGAKVQGTTHLSGLDVYATGSLSAAKVLEGSNRMPKVADGAGSPIDQTISRLILVGSGTTGAGSSVWVAYPSPYSAAPQILVTPGSGALGISFGLIDVTAGSFRVESSAASENFNWISYG